MEQKASSASGCFLLVSGVLFRLRQFPLFAKEIYSLFPVPYSLPLEVLTSMFTPRPIGYVSSFFKSATAIPTGLGAKHEAEGVLNILPEFELGLTDIEGFSHLLVFWVFDRSEGYDLLVTPPSDVRPHGIFSTRFPRRPNPIGLTIVELLGREGGALRVRGVDMLDGTPILDIKPYLTSLPADKLRRGWLAQAEARKG